MAKKKSWKDDPLLKAAITKPEFDDDWAYRVYHSNEEILPMLGKSSISESFGTYDPSAEPNSRWNGTVRNSRQEEHTQSGRFAGERSFPYSEIKTYLRYGPPLTKIGDDGHLSTYHGKEDERSLTLVIEKDHPLGPFVRELRNVEGPKVVVYRFISDPNHGTVLAESIDIRMQTTLGNMVISEHRQSVRFEDYRYTGPAVDEPEPPKPLMQWSDPDLNGAMARLRSFDHERWKYYGRMRAWNAASGEVFADVTFRYDPTIINDEDDQPDPIQDVVDATGCSDECNLWEDGQLWDYPTIEWTIGQNVRKVRSSPAYAGYVYGPNTDPASPDVQRFGKIIIRLVGPHAPCVLSFKQFMRHGSNLSRESNRFSTNAETGDPLLRRTLVFDDTGEPEYTHYRLYEAWDYSRIG